LIGCAVETLAVSAMTITRIQGLSVYLELDILAKAGSRVLHLEPLLLQKAMRS